MVIIKSIKIGKTFGGSEQLHKKAAACEAIPPPQVPNFFVSLFFLYFRWTTIPFACIHVPRSHRPSIYLLRVRPWSYRQWSRRRHGHRQALQHL